MASVFLSYSHKDRKLAKRLAKDLGRNGVEVWLDEWKILVGDSITQSVQQGLTAVDFVIPLLTVASTTSGWVEKEWQSQIGMEASQRQIRVLPVRGDNCRMPVLLADKKHADISNNYRSGLSDLIRAIDEHTKRRGDKVQKGAGAVAAKDSGLGNSPRVSIKRYLWVSLAILFVVAVAFGLVRFYTTHSRRVYEFKRDDAAGMFASRAHIVAPAESYKIREVRQLAPPEFANFELLSDRRVIDLRDWKPFTPGSSVRESPVTWSRKVKAKKIREVEQIRFEFATEGAGIDAECISGEDYRIETGIIPTSPPQLLMKAFHLVVNVTKYKIGEEFEVEFQATFWNGSTEQEDWVAAKIYAPVKMISILILFPDRKVFSSAKSVMYKPESRDELRPEGQGDPIYTPDRRALYWEIINPIKDNIYEVQWRW